MAEPINLNRARKAKTHAEAQAQAAANRVKFGRTKSEKLNDKAEATRLSRMVDQTRREDDPG